MFRERIQFLVALLLVVNGSLWSAQSAALTLGEIELKSGLGESLRATIEIVGDNNIDSNLFSAQLGKDIGSRSQEVLGQLDLSSLSFQVVENEFGSPYILIDSPAQVQQPELDFLVELQWPDDSVTIRVNLLFLAESAAAVAQIVDPDVSRSVYKVSVGDTLWSVASVFRADNSTVWQAMDAMFSVNPSAFLNGDPSKIIIGSDIIGPSYRQISNQSGFYVADRLGLDVYGERSNTNVIADSSVDVTLVSLDVAYSNQEIPYFEVEDSFTTQPVDAERIIVVSASNEQLKTSGNTENSMLALAPTALESPVDLKSEVTRLNDELLDAQNATDEAQHETSDLRAIIISLNDEIVILQDRLQTTEVKEGRAVSPGLGGSKSGYLGSGLSGAQLMALVIVILAGVAVLIYYTVRRVVGGKLEPINDVEVSSESDAGAARLNSESGFSDDEIFGKGDREPADVFANVASRDDAIEESLSNIDSLELSDELHPEGASNLDYLDMTENIDPVDVKLDLAETYADLGDIAGAREILEEIISESNKDGKRRATEVLERLDSNSSS